MKLVKCDRCGHVMDNVNDGAQAVVSYYKYDLCGKCVGQFVNIFMKNHPLKGVTNEEANLRTE